MPDVFVSSPERVEKKPELAKKEASEEKISPVVQQTTNPLAAFIPRPTNLRFETQEKKEKIVLLLRRHMITNLPWLVIALVMIISPTIIVRLVSLDFIPAGFRLIITLAWYLLTFAFAFERFLSWFFNVNVITDERIIDINFPSILYKDISETKIDRIQDVSAKTGGFIRSLFNFGDVAIQTAGTIPEIYFEAIPNPGRVSQVLNDLILEEEKEKLEGRVR